MNAERPRTPNEADRMIRKDGVRKRGCIVKIPHPIVLIVAYAILISSAISIEGRRFTMAQYETRRIGSQ